MPDAPVRSPRTWIWTVSVLAGALLVACVITWPLARGLAAFVPHDLGDPILNTWILWWNAQTIPLTDAWWNPPAFFPATGVLAFSEHLLGLSWISSPIVWMSGSPLLAYNVALLLTFALSAAAMFRLVDALTGRRDAAVIAAALFAFAPYRIAHLSHLQVLASFWMPIGLLGLHRALDTGRVRWIALFAAAWLLQALSNGYYAVFFSVLVVIWLAWFGRGAGVLRVARIGAGWAVAIALFLPVALGYRSVHEHYGLARQMGDIEALSADAASLLSASPLLALWDGLRVFDRNEGQLFPGVTVVTILLASAFMRPERRPAGLPHTAATFHLVAAIAMFVFAMGPSPTFMGTQFLPTAPYAWLMELPGVASLRVPARFGMLMVLCLAIAAGLAYSRMSSSWPRRRRTLVALVVCLACVGETWTNPMPLNEPPPTWHLDAGEITGALLVLPILNEINDVASVYRTRDLGRPLVNGYSGHVPPWYRALKDGLNAMDPAVLDVLAAAGVSHVALVTRHDREGGWREYLLTRARFVRGISDALDLYALPAADPAATVAPPLTRRPVPIVAADTNTGDGPARHIVDGDLHTQWRAAPQQGGEVVVLDLGSIQSFDAVEFDLGRAHEFEYPRRLVIEISNDSLEWRRVWEGECAAAALAGAIRVPNRMPLRFEPGPHAARFVRLRQIGRHRSAGWTIAEARVLAPASPR